MRVRCTCRGAQFGLGAEHVHTVTQCLHQPWRGAVGISPQAPKPKEASRTKGACRLQPHVCMRLSAVLRCECMHATAYATTYATAYATAHLIARSIADSGDARHAPPRRAMGGRAAIQRDVLQAVPAPVLPPPPPPPGAAPGVAPPASCGRPPKTRRPLRRKRSGYQRLLRQA